MKRKYRVEFDRHQLKGLFTWLDYAIGTLQQRGGDGDKLLASVLRPWFTKAAQMGTYPENEPYKFNLPESIARAFVMCWLKMDMMCIDDYSTTHLQTICNSLHQELM